MGKVKRIASDIPRGLAGGSLHSGLLFVLSMLCLFLIASFFSLAEANEKIISFQSNIKVHDDGSMTVKETIRVNSEGDRIRHGIYRDFPVRYRDHAGNSYVVGFAVKEVLRDANPEPFHIENQSNGKRVYIGRKDALITPGEHVYTILYKTDHQLGFFKDFDELYWNVTGNGWEFIIDAATAFVELPEDASRHIISFAGYTGPQGSKEQNFSEIVDDSGLIRFTTTRALGPREGLTIAVSWPKGYVKEPERSEKILHFLTGNIGVILGAAGLLLLVFYYLIIWVRVGKDPDPGTIVTRYTPPDNMTPAVMRFIREMGYDQKIFASAVINMAVKGHLSIKEEEGAYTLTRQDSAKTPLSTPLSIEEEKIKSMLFGSSNKISLEQANHGKIKSAINGLKDYLKLKYEKIYFVTNKGYFLSGLALSALVLFLTGFSDASAKDTLPIFLFMCVWLTIWSLGVTALLAEVISRWRTVFRAGGNGLLAGSSALFLTLFSLPFVAGEIGGIYMLGHSTSALIVFFLLAAIFINYLFYHLLKAPTRAGRGILDAIEGFRGFLSATEKDRMNMMTPPQKTPDLFEKYLPYALALGVEQQWAEQFSGILSSAAAEGERGGGYSPAWYSGGLWHSMSSGDFASSLGDSLSGAISSSSTAPGSSSGSGGGGSSGGGGGGGGGGGW